MTPNNLFYILIAVILVVFFLDSILETLNASYYNKKIPEELNEIYSENEYQKSIKYKKSNYRFNIISSTLSLVITLLFFFFDGFAWVDNIARNITENTILISLLFFGMIIIASEVISIPADYYRIFYIEEKFDFNNTSVKTFLLDKIKNTLMILIFGGIILTVIMWLYEIAGNSFWIYAWVFISLFTVTMNMFYTSFIVPIFNKQTPLEEGEIRNAIEDYSKGVDFELKDIFIIDGSKRSTKANAYFSGFGKAKRITLYDTLLKDFGKEEIVAVLAHEVGHYKKNHILYNLFISIVINGVLIGLLSLFISNPLLSEALGVAKPSFHIGLITFGILYTPISMLTGLVLNFISRAFEYQADNFAKITYNKEVLISSLKKLSKNNLSNLTPHPATVFMHYSHPTLLQRIQNLRN